MKDNTNLNHNCENNTHEYCDYKNNLDNNCSSEKQTNENRSSDNIPSKNNINENCSSETCTSINCNCISECNNKNTREYNKDNIFYKIINKEINSNLVLEGKHFIAINDIRPKAPVHVLVIPKGNYIDYLDFVINASNEEIVDFNKGIAQIIEKMKLLPGGYKLLSNSGLFGQQEVPHMHVHILGKSSN